MSNTSLRLFALTVLLVVATACHRPTQAPAPGSSAALAGPEWTLVELDGQPAPAGAEGRRATLHFAPDSMRVSGFAGCNRVSAGLVLSGDSLRFERPILTRMACAEGMELERRLTTALAATTRFELVGNALTLLGPSGPLARLTRTTP